MASVRFSSIAKDSVRFSSIAKDIVDSSRDQCAVLVVDDDLAMRDTVRLTLRNHGIRVYEAETGSGGITAARSHRLDLIMIDFRLPDMSGLEMMMALKKSGVDVPWILMSGWMTTPIAVDAIKLGAINAVALPFDIEAVTLSALDDVASSHAAHWPRLPLEPFLPAPQSAAERWAWLVLRGCDATHDFKTIREWASFVGISYSSLTECCRLVGIKPHEARDFVRILRALFHRSGRAKNLQVVLKVADHRTLRFLLQHAGLDDQTKALSLQEFLGRQQFVSQTNEALEAILRMIADL